MTAEDLDAHLAQERAAAGLVHAAQQYARVAARGEQGESSQEQLRTATDHLQEAAVAWCLTRGWTPPDGRAPPP